MGNSHENMLRKKMGAGRAKAAEALIYRAMDLLEKAQSKTSALVGIPGNTGRTLADARERIKSTMYALERSREAGTCSVDDTFPMGG